MVVTWVSQELSLLFIAPDVGTFWETVDSGYGCGYLPLACAAVCACAHGLAEGDLLKRFDWRDKDRGKGSDSCAAGLCTFSAWELLPVAFACGAGRTGAEGCPACCCCLLLCLFSCGLGRSRGAGMRMDERTGRHVCFEYLSGELECWTHLLLT